MERFLRLIDATSEWTGKLGSYIIIILILGIGYDITLRYFFAMPNLWIFDSTYMLYGAHTMLGVAYCHLHRGHVRMDLIYGRLSPRGRARMDVICYIVLFFPLLIILVYKCGGHALWSLLYGERSSASVWRPYLGPFKLVISFGLLLFLLQGIADFIRNLRFLIKGESDES